MWIPYDISASLKAETGRESIDASTQDTRDRPFVVGFFLRNPVTQAWELDVHAAPTGEVRLEQATADGQGAQDDQRAQISFCGNDAGKLAEIVVRLHAASATQALEHAHRLIDARLLAYVIETGRGMSIAGWRIADPAHGAQWRCTPFRPSALLVEHDQMGAIPDDLQPFATLYQRARNAPDAVMRLMCAFPILIAAARDHPSLSGSGAGGFRVTREMLVHAVAMSWAPRLTGRGLAELIETLRPHHDRLTGPDGMLSAVSMDLPSRQTLAALANLADLAAHRLLVEELRSRPRGSRAVSRSRANAEAAALHRIRGGMAPA